MIENLGLAGACLMFAVSAVVVVVAGTKLAREGDVIAARTRLGGLWFGSVFLALATSLPELMTSVSAALIGAVDIAAGNLFGSSMANMLILAILTLIPAGGALFARAALDHAMSAALAIVLSCMAGAFVLARMPISVGGVGLGSFVLAVTYLLGTRLLYQHSVLARAAPAVAEMEVRPGPAEGGPGGELGAAPGADEGSAGMPLRSLKQAIVGFLIAALVITATAPLFASSAERIADLTGIGATMVGTVLVGLATSLPEFVTCLAALRIGAFDLAVGNLFGSNAVNMVLFVPVDIAHRAGPVFASVGSSHVISILVGIAMMGMCLVSLVYRAKRRFSMLEPSGLAIIVMYVLGMILVGWRS